MNKRLMPIIASVVALSMTACTIPALNNTTDKDNNNNQNAQITANTPETDPGSATEPETDPDTQTATVVTNEECEDYPEFIVSTNFHKNYVRTNDDGEDFNAVEVTHDTVYLISNEDNNFAYSALSQAVSDFNDKTDDGLRQTFDDLQDEWNQMNNEFGEGTINMVEYEFVYDSVLRADDKIFSIARDTEVYYGGAHGGNYMSGYCFDSQTGELLDIDDFLIKRDGLGELITDILWNEYDHEIFFSSTKNDLLNDVETSIESYMDYAVTYDGIIIYFGEYVLAPYVAGPQIVHIRYSEHPEFLNAEYFEDVPASYVRKAGLCVNYPILVEGIESFLSFSAQKSYHPETGMYSEFYDELIVYGVPYGEYCGTFEMPSSSMDPEIFILRKDRTDYVYVTCYFMDGIETTYVYEPKQDGFEVIGVYNGWISFDNVKDMDMRFHTLIEFGSGYEYMATDAYFVEGGVINTGNVYEFSSAISLDYANFYDVNKDIDGYEVDANDKKTSTAKTIKKGSEVTPYKYGYEGTKQYMIFMDRDGNKTYVDIKDDGGIISINGVNHYDLFTSQW